MRNIAFVIESFYKKYKKPILLINLNINIFLQKTVLFK
jgi:hypothetical protein